MTIGVMNSAYTIESRLAIQFAAVASSRYAPRLLRWAVGDSVDTSRSDVALVAGAIIGSFPRLAHLVRETHALPLEHQTSELVQAPRIQAGRRRPVPRDPHPVGAEIVRDVAFRRPNTDLRRFVQRADVLEHASAA